MIDPLPIVGVWLLIAYSNSKVTLLSPAVSTELGDGLFTFRPAVMVGVRMAVAFMDSFTSNI